MRRSRLLFLVTLLTGCAGLIGVPDLSFDERDEGGADGSADGNATVPEAAPAADANRPDAPGPSDGGLDSAPLVDAATCDLTKVASDKNNCGECGRVCLGPSQCSLGSCEAIPLASLPSVDLRYITQHGDWLFVASEYGSNEYGIWRLSKQNGNPVRIVSTEYVQAPLVIGDRLYFLVYDYPFDDAGQNGGLWYCDLAEAETAATCTPHLAEVSNSPYAIAPGDGGIYYTDYDSLLHKWVPDGGPDAGGRPIPLGVVNAPDYIHVDANDIFFNAAVFGGAYLGKVNAFGTTGVIIAEYPTAARAGAGGNITTTGSSIITTFYDDGLQNERGGELRRLTRSGGTECVYASADGGVLRPLGIHLDGPRMYWTNQGEAYFPQVGGSVAMCPVDGCCTEPKVLWRGVGAPSGIVGDATYLYWVNRRNGEVWKVQKP